MEESLEMMNMLAVILQRNEVFGAWGRLFLIPVFIIGLIVFIIMIYIHIRDYRRDKFDRKFRDREDWRNRWW